MEQNPELLKCYIEFLEAYAKKSQGDLQWIVIPLNEFKSEGSNYYANKFYKINSNEIKEEIKNNGTMTLNKWNGQKTLIFGCGHVNTTYGENELFEDSKYYQIQTHCHNTREEYMVDNDITILPDLLATIGENSLILAIPEARGKIQKIIVEGFCADETDILYNDFMELLEDGGVVFESETIPVLAKKDNELYAIEIIDEEYIFKKYAPWTNEDVENGTYGYDLFGWKENLSLNGFRIKELKKKELISKNAIEYMKMYK
jgi:hypothetical protein